VLASSWWGVAPCALGLTGSGIRWQSTGEKYGFATSALGKAISRGKWEQGRAKTSHDECRGSFCDAAAGPPTSWVPLVPASHCASCGHARKPAHIPQKRGGAWWAGVRGLKDGGGAR
jgi:hypothetical protein